MLRLKLILVSKRGHWAFYWYILMKFSYEGISHNSSYENVHSLVFNVGDTHHKHILDTNIIHTIYLLECLVTLILLVCAHPYILYMDNWLLHYNGIFVWLVYTSKVLLFFIMCMPIHPLPKVLADFFQTQKSTWCPHSIGTIFGGCMQYMQMFIFLCKIYWLFALTSSAPGF